MFCVLERARNRISSETGYSKAQTNLKFVAPGRVSTPLSQFKFRIQLDHSPGPCTEYRIRKHIHDSTCILRMSASCSYDLL